MLDSVHCTPASEQTRLIVAGEVFKLKRDRARIAKALGYTTHTSSPNRRLRKEAAKNQVLKSYEKRKEEFSHGAKSLFHYRHRARTPNVSAR
jgi:hypothetical protein